MSKYPKGMQWRAYYESVIFAHALFIVNVEHFHLLQSN